MVTECMGTSRKRKEVRGGAWWLTEAKSKEGQRGWQVVRVHSPGPWVLAPQTRPAGRREHSYQELGLGGQGVRVTPLNPTHPTHLVPLLSREAGNPWVTLQMETWN